jgi:hypothetical protein
VLLAALVLLLAALLAATCGTSRWCCHRCLASAPGHSSQAMLALMPATQQWQQAVPVAVAQVPPLLLRVAASLATTATQQQAVQQACLALAGPLLA